MKKPLMKLNLELWETSSDFVTYGIPWWMKAIWYVFNRPFHDRMISLATKKTLFARGFYDRFRSKVVICTTDMMISTLEALREARKKGYVVNNVHGHFGLQTYFTLVHEMLHHANVAKDDAAGGHKINFDKFERLPESLKDIFDGLLELENSKDAFSVHPDNRRNDNEKED